MPLVSIITPTYNRANYLPETIDSIITQDYPHLEYIVLDDGSTDNTPELLVGYADKIIWESHPNMGVSRTVNKGIGLAQGEIIAIVNSDDPLLPGAVTKTVDFMQSRSDILVAYPDWNMIGPNSELIKHIQVPEYDYLYMLREHHCLPGPGAFIRRKAFDLVGGRDPEFWLMDDYEFWLRLGLHGEFARIPETLASFRVHPTSVSVNERGVLMAKQHVGLMDKFYSTPNLPDEVLAVKNEAYRRTYSYAGHMLGGGHPITRRYYYLAELRHIPIRDYGKHRNRLRVIARDFFGIFYKPFYAIYILFSQPKRFWAALKDAFD